MTAWTDITDATIDQDSPWDEDRTQEFRDNLKHLRERQARHGTDSTGVRYATAQGSFTFSISISAAIGKTHTEAITFSSAADDGDPNFSATPTHVRLTLEETGSDHWGIATDWTIVTAQVAYNTLSSTAMTVDVFAKLHLANTATVTGKCYWEVDGAPTGTE